MYSTCVQYTYSVQIIFGMDSTDITKVHSTLVHKALASSHIHVLSVSHIIIVINVHKALYMYELLYPQLHVHVHLPFT